MRSNIKIVMSVFSLIAVFLIAAVHMATAVADEADASASCMFSDKAVVLYGQTVCPDKFNKDDEFAQWDEMVAHMPEFIPGAFGEETKTPAELCEHVKTLRIKYSIDAEIYMYKLSDSLGRAAKDREEVQAYIARYKENVVPPDSPASAAVINTLLWEDKETTEEFVALFPEQVQIKVRMVKDLVDKARYLTLLNDSVLDTCPDYAAEKGYYKIINYNGPDAKYDAEEDPEWDTVRDQWDKNKAEKDEDQETE